MQFQHPSLCYSPTVLDKVPALLIGSRFRQENPYSSPWRIMTPAVMKSCFLKKFNII